MHRTSHFSLVVDDFPAAANDVAYRALLPHRYSTGLTKVATQVANSFDTIVLSSGSAMQSPFQSSRLTFGSLTSANASLLPVLTRLADDGAKTVGYFFEDQTFTREVCAAIPAIIARLQLDLTIVHVAKVPEEPSEADIAQVLDEYETAPDIFIGCTYFEECIMSLNMMESRQFVPGAKIFTLCATDADFSSRAGNAGLYTLTGKRCGLSPAHAQAQSSAR